MDLLAEALAGGAAKVACKLDGPTCQRPGSWRSTYAPWCRQRRHWTERLVEEQVSLRQRYEVAAGLASPLNRLAPSAHESDLSEHAPESSVLLAYERVGLASRPLEDDVPP